MTDNFLKVRLFPPAKRFNSVIRKAHARGFDEKSERVIANMLAMLSDDDLMVARWYYNKVKNGEMKPV